MGELTPEQDKLLDDLLSQLETYPHLRFAQIRLPIDSDDANKQKSSSEKKTSGTRAEKDLSGLQEHFMHT